MFAGWENFYLTAGSAAGALIGLTFVVVTLAVGLQSTKGLTRGGQVYLSPIVFHFAVVLVVSEISAIPEISPTAASIVVAMSALGGFSYSVLTSIRMFAPEWPNPPEWSDKW